MGWAVRFWLITLILLFIATSVSTCGFLPRAFKATSPTTTPQSITLPALIPDAPQTVSPIPPSAASLLQTPFIDLIALETLGNPKYGGAALSDDGSVLAVGDGALVRIWSTQSGNEVQTLSGLDGRAYVIVFSPDASLVALFDNDFIPEIWEVESGRLISTFPLTTPGAEVMNLAFSPDGKSLASGHRDHNVRLWDMETGQITLTLKGHIGNIMGVAFSPDGSLLASGEVNTGYTIKLWNITSGLEIKTLTGHHENVYSLSFSPDGRYLASASGDLTVRLWDVESGEEVRTFTGHSDRTYSVAFSPDGTWLASGGSDRTVRIWDARNGQALQVLRGSRDMTVLGFSPDGLRLFTVDDGEPVGIWGVSH